MEGGVHSEQTLVGISALLGVHNIKQGTFFFVEGGNGERLNRKTVGTEPTGGKLSVKTEKSLPVKTGRNTTAVISFAFSKEGSASACIRRSTHSLLTFILIIRNKEGVFL